MFARRRAYLLIPQYDLEFNTNCRRKSDVDIECPIEKGPYNVTQTVALPREIPPGTLTLLKAPGPSDLPIL
jgi:hypothetical protein